MIANFFLMTALVGLALVYAFRLFFFHPGGNLATALTWSVLKESREPRWSNFPCVRLIAGELFFLWSAAEGVSFIFSWKETNFGDALTFQVVMFFFGLVFYCLVWNEVEKICGKEIAENAFGLWRRQIPG